MHEGNKCASQPTMVMGDYTIAIEVEHFSSFVVDIKNTEEQNVKVHHIEIPDRNVSVLADSIKENLDAASPLILGSEYCIHRVSEKFREINECLYTPEMVSIGPFHHGKESLKAMDNLKLRYVNAFLSRATKMEWQTTYLECVESVKVIEEAARKWYSEPIKLNSDEFVEMMLYDGLFILELFRKNVGEVEVERDDPLFGNIHSLSTLVRDLVLLENQLPMFVLERLVNLPALKEELHGSCTITVLALHFFNLLIPRDKEVLEKCIDFEGKHLLDLFSKTFHFLPKRAKSRNNLWKFVPSVMELKNAGIKFKKGSEKGNFLDIKFSKGVLELSPIIIQDQTASLLGNLIAFEQGCGGHVSYMTSYVFFMNSIINSTSDVGLLKNQGIIKNHLSGDEDVYNLFTKLCNEVTLGDFYYSELCDQVNSYREKAIWHAWRAILVCYPSKKRWALLVLTIMSALFVVVIFAIRMS